MKAEDINRVAVIGAGIMAHGIAHVCAQAGYQVTMTTRRKETLERARSNIKLELETLVESQIITQAQADAAASRIHTTLDRSEAIKDADFVIEAIKEDMVLKKQIFKDLDDQCPKHAILATNTSSFSITELATAVNREDKVVGMHWWNPPYLMPLVEIIKGANTSDDTVDLTTSFTNRLGKVPVVCKDSPGFIGVRLQAALFIEAIAILEQGLASAEDIDTTVRMSLGIRTPVIGPMETVDMGGLDTFLYAYDYLRSKLGEKFKPPDLLRGLVEEGRLGLKTGKGFYEHTPEAAEALKKRRDTWILQQLKDRAKELTSRE
jgi:3-hydroxybutyryl-CoA dehydrogenase